MLAHVNAGDHKPPAFFLKACSLQFHASAGEPNYRSLSVLVLEVVGSRDMPVIGEGKDSRAREFAQLKYDALCGSE
jgi:hypothetical protein